MIHKNVEIGKHTIPVVIDMGVGDVEMRNHHCNEGEFTMISFTDSEPKPIGKVIRFEEGTTSDDLESIPVAVRFTNPKSIDALINQLELSKAKLIEIIGG